MDAEAHLLERLLGVEVSALLVVGHEFFLAQLIKVLHDGIVGGPQFAVVGAVGNTESGVELYRGCNGTIEDGYSTLGHWFATDIESAIFHARTSGKDAVIHKATITLNSKDEGEYEIDHTEGNNHWGKSEALDGIGYWYYIACDYKLVDIETIPYCQFQHHYR